VSQALLAPSPRVRWDVTIPDLTGRVVLLTGATNGIGLTSACRLGAAGAEVVMVACDKPRATRVVHRLRKVVPHGAFRVEYADLADLASVRSLADRLLHQNRPLSLVINAAGVVTNGQRRLSNDGFELQLAVNHLAPFALTGLLMPLLRLAHGPRVVALGSLGASRARIDLCDLQRVQQPSAAYGQSKLAQLMFTHELDRRSRIHGWGVSAVAAHPGYAATRSLPSQVGKLGRMVGLTQNTAEGALPVLLAATDPYVRSGEYYGPQHRLGLSGPPGPVTMPAQVHDSAVTQQLWDRSQELTGVTWPRA
jgi:NAD(P)-dependent dehydrogenase (short-subunit alcohol dehydrogenase family)